MCSPRSTDDEVDAVYRLVAGIMRRAVADARQTANPELAQEAWQFLEICAPTVAEELRRRMHNVRPSDTAQVAGEQMR